MSASRFDTMPVAELVAEIARLPWGKVDLFHLRANEYVMRAVIGGANRPLHLDAARAALRELESDGLIDSGRGGAK